MLTPSKPCSRNMRSAASRIAARLAGSLGRPGAGLGAALSVGRDIANTGPGSLVTMACAASTGPAAPPGGPAMRAVHGCLRTGAAALALAPGARGAGGADPRPPCPAMVACPEHAPDA